MAEARGLIESRGEGERSDLPTVSITIRRHSASD